MKTRMQLTELPLGIKCLEGSRLHGWQIAHFLIAGGVRPINVEAVTRINRAQLNALWKNVHGFPAKGQTPIYSSVYLRSHRAVREGIAFVKILQMYELSEDIKSPEIFLMAYQRFRELVPWVEDLQMEKAFYLWRDYHRKLVVLNHCSQCKGSYLYTMQPDASDTMRNCTFCRLLKQSSTFAKKMQKPH
ncbi:hypothetical protein HER14_14450 [Acidithiobacillus thiooxidans]|uniref:FlhC family transcriptional regulator n=1 Tax=Acidithiobacillus thiooxidans TaxID=930 RepID=UPI001C0704AE|nr:FlhC family transcriptional regulator [Acidithiobacillus thiooxidans]MBU2752099.1 hypothetical protein [Acidithiobacillus thiooxidans]MDA8152413.1 FlhC family transcriptional regulator [Acidithiobacillus sp.]